MPGKSRRGKGKHLPPNRRRKDGQGHPAGATPPPAAVPIADIKAAPEKVTAKTRVLPEKLAAPRYPYVGTELMRIAVLTAVIVVILLVLAAVLPRA